MTINRRGVLRLLGLGAAAAVVPAGAPEPGTLVMVADRQWITQGVFTVPSSGWYSVSGVATIDGAGTLEVLKNGVVVTQSIGQAIELGSPLMVEQTLWTETVRQADEQDVRQSMRLDVNAIVPMAPGDVISLRSTSTATGDLLVARIV
jgi:hypothetical protein